MTIKLGIVGGLGRMGLTIVKELMLNNNNNITLAGVVVQKENPYIGKDVGKVINAGIEIGIKVTHSIEELFNEVDVVIDFSNPQTTLQCLKIAQNTHKPLVSGTTGIENIDLLKFSKDTPILWSANMSIGINLLSKVVEYVAQVLGNDYDVEISEMHHNLKKDAPSGTAIMLGKAAARGLNIDFKINQHLSTNNYVRQPNSIGFAVSRGGNIIGDHNVMFVNSGEMIEIKHRAFNRQIYAQGAIKAASWLVNQQPGLYSMLDIFNNKFKDI